MSLLFILLGSPLLGAIINGLVLRPGSAKKAGTLATLFAGISFLATIGLFVSLQASGPVAVSWDWFAAGDLHLKWGLRFDQLTAVMALVVTGIGTLIHLYSVGYMSEEPGPYRYFAYLNLFLFNMLVLITSDNLVGLFVGWEGVGLCSYLLIGYWYTDPEKAKAGMKAFLVNRIGDAGFLIGLFLCYQLFGTVEFEAIGRVLSTATHLDLFLVNLCAFFLFVGATGKSAQVPLYVWLPDAMAGPTPVSALIHAATMVTAGLYLIARLNGVFIMAEHTNSVIAYVGLVTALLAACIATSQKDIKKVLAYSTVSQLGLMFLAMGCRAYVAGVFHLMTHAFFKALLFLGSGSVIHALSGEQDIEKMGGLKKSLPVTYWTFLIGTLAISGIPPLAGFFSKDTILHAALVTDFKLWLGAAVVATLTAFYMARLFTLTFLGEYRGHAHPHESPAVMTIPLVVLAVGSALTGFLSVPHELHFLPNFLEHFLSPLIPIEEMKEPAISGLLAMAITTSLAILSVGAGWFLMVSPARRQTLNVFAPLRMVFENKFWIDELYGILIVKPFEGLSRFLSSIIDPKVIDGSVMLTARFVRAAGGVVAWFHWGAIQFYLLVMLLGTLVVAGLMLRGSVL